MPAYLILDRPGPKSQILMSRDHFWGGGGGGGAGPHLGGWRGVCSSGLKPTQLMDSGKGMAPP